MKAVIVAAGMGTRMNGEKPKTLLPFHGETVLSTIIRNITQAGIRQVVVVVGHQADHIREYVSKNKAGLDAEISLVENPQYRRGNGISVLASEHAVGNDSFILSMSDHIVSSSAVARVVRNASAANLLLVDRRITENFDIDDATKVRTESPQTDGSRILRIGKDLTEYNALDCGIFRLTPRFYESMRSQLAHDRESISDAVKGLIKNNDMEAVFLQDGEQWFDLDTPEAYAHALSQTASAPPL
jgi:choline kinase